MINFIFLAILTAGAVCSGGFNIPLTRIKVPSSSSTSPNEHSESSAKLSEFETSGSETSESNLFNLPFEIDR